MKRLLGEPVAVEKQQQQPCQQQQKHPQHNTTSPASGQTTTVTLAFKERTLEEQFKGWYDDAATAHDAQAASIYLWMVAMGSLLYLIIMAYSPTSRPANVDKCTVLIACSWLGPSAHLLLLRLLPRATYVQHRTRIIVALRTFYIGATSVNGFGLCGVGPLQEKKHAVAGALHTNAAVGAASAAAAAAAAVFRDAAAGFGPSLFNGTFGGEGVSINSTFSSSVISSSGSGARCPAESPYSALLWRSGIIGLIWWGSAFPLPFSTHVVMQAASTALYMATLAPTVCSTMPGVRSGTALLQTIRGVGDTLAGQLLAAVGVPRPPAAAAAAAAGSSAAGSDCVAVLAYVQVVLGLLLPVYAKYCFEARKRRSWWRDMQAANSSSSSAAAAAASVAPGLDGSNGGSSGGSNGSSGGLPTLDKLEVAAVAAMAAAKEGWDWGYGKYCKASGTAAAAAAVVGVGEETHCGEGFGGSSSGSSSGSSGSSSSSSGSSGRSSLLTAGAVQQQQQQQVKGPAAAAAAAAEGDVDEVALLAAVDAWDRSSSSSSGLPPRVTDVFVLLVVMAVTWVLLSQVLQ